MVSKEIHFCLCKFDKVSVQCYDNYTEHNKDNMGQTEISDLIKSIDRLNDALLSASARKIAIAKHIDRTLREAKISKPPQLPAPDAPTARSLPAGGQEPSSRSLLVSTMAEYENILSIIQKTAMMLERSPRSFRDMDEEGLRDQFLVPLNSHYAGQANGETFNFYGKTDILVRDGDRTVFVAECKVWRGPKALSSAIDQLLGYVTWRDTKTALLVFNRNRKLTEVLAQIPGVLKSHPNFKRMVDFTSETGFRCVLAHKDDPNREVILTVLVFEVPR